jgi:DNA repair photolyase
MSKKLNEPLRGRGTSSYPDGRYLDHTREAVDDGWNRDDEDAISPRTVIHTDTSRTIINYNDSPDIGFDRSINPYRGCEHGCVYCFARPTHAYLDLSPGLDFETQLFAKPDAVKLLRKELAKKNYRPAPIALGINTDSYQPIERKLKLTRQVLEVLLECRHPVTIVTKSALIERDIDLLSALAAQDLCQIFFSITTLDNELARTLEPRAAAPPRRLQAMSALHQAGIPVGVLVAPVIPFLNDQDMESILEAAHTAGARSASYVLLRLPLEVKPLFMQWLEEHYPDRKEHVLNRMRDSHGGKEYRLEFGTRMRGTGVFAELIKKRFQRAHKQLGFAGMPELRCDLFVPPPVDESQLKLF